MWSWKICFEEILSKLKFWALIISCVGNLELSVGIVFEILRACQKIATFCLAYFFNRRCRWICQHHFVVIWCLDAASVRDAVVSEAFLRFFVETCGHYTDYVCTQQDGQRVFEVFWGYFCCFSTYQWPVYAVMYAKCSVIHLLSMSMGRGPFWLFYRLLTSLCWQCERLFIEVVFFYVYRILQFEKFFKAVFNCFIYSSRHWNFFVAHLLIHSFLQPFIYEYRCTVL